MPVSSEPTPGAGPNGTPAPGLPPVMPPSGRFLAQLFLIPGLLVAVATLIILLFAYVADSGRTPEHFLATLDSKNVEIRWRGASDLAQVIEKSPVLKTDVTFALELTDRLRKALTELREQENDLHKEIALLPEAKQKAAWRVLQPKRDFVDFLAADLGHFYAPVAIPILCEIINREESPDAQGHTMTRRKALWALSNLGHRVKAFAQELRPVERGAIIENLRSEAAGDTPRAGWARTALHYLDPDAVPADAAGVVLVDRALDECSRTQDRYLRVQVAMALNFWDGERVEETLLRLTKDDGFGTLIRIEEAE